MLRGFGASVVNDWVGFSTCRQLLVPGNSNVSGSLVGFVGPYALCPTLRREVRGNQCQVFPQILAHTGAILFFRSKSFSKPL